MNGPEWTKRIAEILEKHPPSDILLPNRCGCGALMLYKESYLRHVAEVIAREIVVEREQVLLEAAKAVGESFFPPLLPAPLAKWLLKFSAEERA